MDAKSIKVDGVSLNVAYVKGLRRADFVKHPQIRGLFHRIPEARKDEALSTIYSAITGREKRGAGGTPSPQPTPEATEQS